MGLIDMMEDYSEYGTYSDEAERLYCENAKLVPFVMNKKFTNVTEAKYGNLDDFESAMSWALFKASKTYKPEIEVIDEQGRKVTRKVQFATYAVGIMINEGKMWLRKFRRMEERGITVCSIDYLIPNEKGNKDAPLSDLIADESAEEAFVEMEAESILQEIKDRYGDTLEYKMWELSAIEGKTQREIVHLTGYTQSYVSRKIAKFQKKLNHVLGGIR